VHGEKKDDIPANAPDTAPDAQVLTPEARRALEEAEARRSAAKAAPAAPREVGGRTGPEPTRYGDWETGGITSDF
jgi:hypothetical protein